MKFLLVIASVVALASASPASRGIVNPSPAPAPAPEYEPIGVGPTPILPDEAIDVPVAPAPETVDTPLVQIILNINSAGQVETVIPGLPVAEAPVQPVQVVDSAPEPVEVVLPVVPSPAEIGTPVLPSPEFIPEPEVIGDPILPVPVVVLPEQLN